TSLTAPDGFEVRLDPMHPWSDNLAFDVPWDSMRTVYVHFVPTVRNLYTGFLTIESNDVDDTVVQIALTGNSVEPMPNAFTPNADGLNDNYVIKFVNGGAEAVRMRIFDLRGREVITIEGVASNPLIWDGRDDSGNACVANPYLYILERSGEITKRGKVYLIR
ncbi:MAG: gliding motility-associated C-terminal domain-containing protein, partial [Candidatus Cloacimonetes bacterium]|nr:gliding motility-associated C-terminal domain-containing protein [Candidatus Cloacimonadota bacterium]